MSDPFPELLCVRCLALGGHRERGASPLAERTSLRSGGLWLCVLFLLELGPREQEMEDGGPLTPREEQGRGSWTGAPPSDGVQAWGGPREGVPECPGQPEEAPGLGDLLGQSP